MNIEFTRQEIKKMQASYECGLDEAVRRLMNARLRDQLSKARSVEELKTVLFHLIDRGFPAD